jgi:Ca2+-binding EF-hand superfamily protein
MGCTVTKSVSQLALLRSRFPKTLSILELQQYSKRLAELFLEHERTGTLMLSLDEFLGLCRLGKNRVTERIFAICDMDGNNALDFREMCFAVWQVCTLAHDGLTALLFDLYDEYNNGLIEFDDVERMLADSYGGKNISGEELQAMIEFVKEKGTLTRADFIAFCERCPQVLKQMVDTQRTMRVNVLGLPVWRELARRRKLKTDPVFRAANWAQLMERIIVMDMDSREEQERMIKALEKKLGRRIRRPNVHKNKRNGGGDADMDDEDRVVYEP